MEIVYIGVKGSVVALNRETGEELWTTSLTGSDFVSVLLDGDMVLAATRGEVFCLSARSGEVCWSNNLPGRGWGLISMASAQGGTSFTLPAEEQQRREQQADAAT